MSKAIRQSRSCHCRQTVCGIPNRDSKWLLDTTVPLARDYGKERHTAGLEKTQEEAGREQLSEAITRSHA